MLCQSFFSLTQGFDLCISERITLPLLSLVHCTISFSFCISDAAILIVTFTFFISLEFFAFFIVIQYQLLCLYLKTKYCCACDTPYLRGLTRLLRIDYLSKKITTCISVCYLAFIKGLFQGISIYKVFIGVFYQKRINRLKLTRC